MAVAATAESDQICVESASKMKWLLFLAVTSVLLEVLAYTRPEGFEAIAAVWWVTVGAGVVGLSLVEIGKALITDARQKFVLGFVVLAGWVIMVSFGSSQWVMMGGESAQQVADALAAFKKPGWEYTGTAFLGYPMRQYYLAAVPTLAGGRSVTALTWGYITPLLLGLGVGYAGIRQLMPEKKGGYLAAAVLAGMTSSIYVLKYSRMYEQAIFPLAFTLLAGGWWLIFGKKPTWKGAIALMWSGGLLGTSYTPTLAGWGLMLATVGGWSALQGRKKNWRYLAMGVAIFTGAAVNGGLAMRTRSDIFKPDRMEWVNGTDSGRVLVDGFYRFAQTGYGSFWGPVMVVPAVAFLGLAGTGFLGGGMWVLAVWAIAAVGLALYLPGYADPPADFSLHRAIFVIPVVLGAVAWQIYRRSFGKDEKWVALVATAVVLAAAVVTGKNFGAVIAERQPGPRTYLLQDMRETAQALRWPEDQPITYGVFSSETDFLPMKDYMRYFYPAVATWINTVECPRGTGLVIIYSQTGKCLDKFAGDAKVAGATVFAYPGGEMTRVAGYKPIAR